MNLKPQLEILLTFTVRLQNYHLLKIFLNKFWLRLLKKLISEQFLNNDNA